VCKKITEQHALLQSVFLIFFGLVLIFQIGNSKALLAGIVAVLLYNVVYTRLKERTLYALLPGALCGAMPPYIGYLAAESGGSVFHAALPVLLLFFWQVPHFFLILMNHKQDYLSGPVPNLLQRLGEPVLQRILLPWIAALAMIMLAFTVMPSSLGDIASSLIVMNALSLIGVFAFQLLYRKEPSYGFLFRYLNISLLFMMIVVCSAIV
jgi:protoheme IX farnesyltransferase